MHPSILSPRTSTQAEPSRLLRFHSLTRLAGSLGSRALSTLLALDTLSSALGGRGGVLGLLGLLAALGGGLLLLGFLDGLLAGGGTGLRTHGTALLDDVEGGTDDSTLVLYNTAGTLLGDFLFFELLSACVPRNLCIFFLRSVCVIESYNITIAIYSSFEFIFPLTRIPYSNLLPANITQ